ncbi:cobalamin biosynthesis protein [Chloroflexota bacterium]
MNGLDILLILPLALLLDYFLGEPPLPCHPVVWMGKLIEAGAKLGRRLTSGQQFYRGLGMLLVIAVLFAGGAVWLLTLLKSWHYVVYIIGAAALLKTTFAAKELSRAAYRTKAALDDEAMETASDTLEALVSRRTEGLDKPLMVSAAVESVAESICDSVVAPLFYFVLFGVPGAMAYRVINTLDAMIGYRGDNEYLGKASAVADDIINYIPARITAGIIILTAILKGGGDKAWQTAKNEHRKTASPNAGWPIAAMAGALEVHLNKTGSYNIGEQYNLPDTGAIAKSVKTAWVSVVIWGVICLVAGGWLFVYQT